MRAIGYKSAKPVTEADALLDLELPMPQAKGLDLLVAVSYTHLTLPTKRIV